MLARVRLETILLFDRRCPSVTSVGLVIASLQITGVGAREIVEGKTALGTALRGAVADMSC